MNDERPRGGRVREGVPPIVSLYRVALEAVPHRELHAVVGCRVVRGKGLERLVEGEDALRHGAVAPRRHTGRQRTAWSLCGRRARKNKQRRRNKRLRFPEKSSQLRANISRHPCGLRTAVPLCIRVAQFRLPSYSRRAVQAEADGRNTQHPARQLFQVLQT